MLALSAELRNKFRSVFRGKVFLVGAGPGDWGLLTLRGAMFLSIAEVVVYDHLIDVRELDFVPEDAELIYAGKQAGNHELSQNEINDLLVNRARDNKVVVRLKGGDPWIFGRGAEEAEFLSAKGIPFEIVPGVSALTAAPSAAGIPLTHRKYTSSFVVATGHEASSKSDASLDYKILSKVPGSIVIFMGVKNLGFISSELINGGRSAGEPAAIVSEGYTTSQRVISAPLSQIAERARLEGIKPPALFIVSPTVELKEQLMWFEKRPLWGLRVVVTRPRTQAMELALSLELLGASVIFSPAIEVEPIKETSAIDSALKNLSSYDLLVFTSVNGVQYFMRRLFEVGFDVRRLAGLEIAAIGEATSNELKKFGIIPEHVPSRFTSAELVKKLSVCSKSGRALLIRSALAPKDFEDALAKAGFEITRLETYTVREVPLSEEAISDLKKGVDWLTFASGSAAKGFLSSLPNDIAKSLKKHAKVLSIGPETSKTIRALGWNVDCEAKLHTSWGMVESLLEYLRSQR